MTNVGCSVRALLQEGKATTVNHLHKEGNFDYVTVGLYLVSEGEGHDDEAKAEVSKGEAGYEPVLDSAERVLSGDGDDDKHVSDHHQHHHHRDDDRDQDDLRVAVLTRVGDLGTNRRWNNKLD